MRYFVLSVSWFPETPEDSIRVDIDGHTGQEENVTNEKARIIKPAHIIVEVVGEVATLHIAIHQREEERTKSWDKRSRLPMHTQRKEENPIFKQKLVIITSTNYKQIDKAFISFFILTC